MVEGVVVNFCRSGHISCCAAAGQKEQAVCRFYEKARVAERCMYFIFEEYCDCLKAQLDSQSRK